MWTEDCYRTLPSLTTLAKQLFMFCVAFNIYDLSFLGEILGALFREQCFYFVMFGCLLACRQVRLNLFMCLFSAYNIRRSSRY